MFSKIVVALNDLPESLRALQTAIDIAASFKSSLATVSILGDLPAYTAFAIVVDPDAHEAIREARLRLHNELHGKAAELARERGVQVRSAIVEGREVEAVLDYVRREKADLLILGLHQHDFYLSRLWSSVYDLAKDAPCSVLGVH
jgi:nucleotide-binding universal stress UspA family protein